MNAFFEMVNKRWDTGARVCVGFDPDPEFMPSEYCAGGSSGQLAFMTDVLQKVAPRALCVKVNRKFFHDTGGLLALESFIDYVHRKFPDLAVIHDGKDGDIGNSMRGASTEIFDVLKADGATASPYLGHDSLEPLLARTDKGVFVLCRTSNKSATQFQNLEVRVPVDDKTTVIRLLYEHVAYVASEKWNAAGNCGLVVGATAPEELKRVREIVGDMPILIPGIGKQGGDLAATVRSGVTTDKRGIIITISSGIIFALDQRRAIANYTNHINDILATM